MICRPVTNIVDHMLNIRTSVIGGNLAFQMRRAAAARANECGLQILTLPQLAARLAGGFTTPLAMEELDLAVQRALAEGGFLRTRGGETSSGDESGGFADVA
jgi:hypothetical protein